MALTQAKLRSLKNYCLRQIFNFPQLHFPITNFGYFVQSFLEIGLHEKSAFAIAFSGLSACFRLVTRNFSPNSGYYQPDLGLPR